jgi:phenylpyruvate tautomerase PptA (4-oxalocrotonate tautomerase family)
MPYLQLDVPAHYQVDVKRRLARRVGDQFARIMQTTPNLVTVAFRELPRTTRCGMAQHHERFADIEPPRAL